MYPEAQLILDKLDEYGILLYNHYASEKGNYVILVDRSIIIYNDELKEARVSFHVSTTPSHSASFVLILKEIEELNDVTVMEVFVYDKDMLLSGDEATDHYERKRIEDTITKFMEEQQALYMLASEPPQGSA